VILPGAVEAAIPSVPGLDSDAIITPALAQQFYALGYKFCLRYISLGKQSPQDLSTKEATDILSSGLALMPVQHVRKPGWSPSALLGQRDGQNAATNAQQVGLPPGVNVWCDAEGVSSAATPQDVIDYCQAWHSAVEIADYIPGLYVGCDTKLTGEQLRDLSFQHYWRSQSSVPEIPHRGYQIIQLFPSISAVGIAIDLDVTQTDREGGQAQWLRLAI
jgi:hypothetical protein